MNVNRFSPFARSSVTPNTWPASWQPLFTANPDAVTAWNKLYANQQQLIINTGTELFGVSPSSGTYSMIELLIEAEVPGVDPSQLDTNTTITLFGGCLQSAFQSYDTSQWTTANKWWNCLPDTVKVGFAWSWWHGPALTNTSSFETSYDTTALYTQLQNYAASNCPGGGGGGSGGGNKHKGGGGNKHHHTPPPPPPVDTPVIVGVVLVSVLGIFFYYKYHGS